VTKRFFISAYLILALLAAVEFYSIFLCYQLLYPAMRKNAGEELLSGYSYEKVKITKDKRQATEGIYIPPPYIGSPVMICLPPYGSNVYDIFPAVSFLSHKYGILLVGPSGAGKRAEKAEGLGYNEEKEIRAAVDFLMARDVTRAQAYGVWGFKDGATAALFAAYQNPNIKVLILDTPYSRLKESARKNVRYLPPLAKGFFRNMALWNARLLFRINPGAADPMAVIGKLQIPVMIIHSTLDRDVPVQNALDLYKRAPEPKYLWILDRDRDAAGEEYRDEIKNYLQIYFKGALFVPDRQKVSMDKVILDEYNKFKKQAK